MWNALYCYLSGGHDFAVWCQPGAIFLRCVHCGKRSNGWELQGAQALRAPAAPIDRRVTQLAPVGASHVAPFPSQRALQ